MRSRRGCAALFKQYEWIRYDRKRVTGSLAARFVHTQVREKHGQLEFDSAPAIVAMVDTDNRLIAAVRDAMLSAMGNAQQQRTTRGMS